LIPIVDTGPLYAAVDANDPDHGPIAALFERPEIQLVLPALAVAEALYLIATRLGPLPEATFARGLASLDIEVPEPEDWVRIAELVEQYADFPLGGTDASVVALAERLETDVVITLDRRHFGAIRPRHCEALRLLPD
jgi:predicted nucleic acid-binding protein